MDGVISEEVGLEGGALLHRVGNDHCFGIGTDIGPYTVTGIGPSTFLVVGVSSEEVGLEGGASHDSGVNATSRPHALMFSLRYKLCTTSDFEAVKIAE